MRLWKRQPLFDRPIIFVSSALVKSSLCDTAGASTEPTKYSGIAGRVTMGNCYIWTPGRATICSDNIFVSIVNLNTIHEQIKTTRGIISHPQTHQERNLCPKIAVSPSNHRLLPATVCYLPPTLWKTNYVVFKLARGFR